MDGGFRAPRPAERRVVNRMEPSYQQPAPSPAPVPVPPKPVRPAVTPHSPAKKDAKSSRRFVIPIIVILVIILGALAWFVWSNRTAGTAIDSGKFQAVSLTDGQIYFGKLKLLNSEYVKLTNAYYLQAQTGATTDASSSSDTSTDQNNVKLIKLGNKIYGPEDDIVIAKDQILSYENLNPSGQVAKWLQKNSNS